MDKNEILEKSRRENNNRDLAEMSIAVQAGSAAARAGAFLCGLVSLISVWMTGTLLCAPWIIYFGILGTSYFVRYQKARRKSDLYLCFVFLLMLLTVLVFFILRLRGVSS